MASRAASYRVGAAEWVASTTLRAISDLASAVGEGFRARNEYCALVGQGADPARAAAAAIRHAESV